MYSIALAIYAAATLNSLGVLAIVAGIVCVVLYIANVISVMVNNDDLALYRREKKPYPKYTFLIFAFVLWTIAALIPSERTIYLMAGASFVQNTASTPQAMELGNKILNKLNEVLETKKKD